MFETFELQTRPAFIDCGLLTAPAFPFRYWMTEHGHFAFTAKGLDGHYYTCQGDHARLTLELALQREPAKRSPPRVLCPAGGDGSLFMVPSDPTLPPEFLRLENGARYPLERPELAVGPVYCGRNAIFMSAGKAFSSWDIETGKLLRTIAFPDGEVPLAIFPSADRYHVCVTTTAEEVRSGTVTRVTFRRCDTMEVYGRTYDRGDQLIPPPPLSVQFQNGSGFKPTNVVATFNTEGRKLLIAWARNEMKAYTPYDGKKAWAVRLAEGGQIDCVCAKIFQPYLALTQSIGGLQGPRRVLMLIDTRSGQVHQIDASTALNMWIKPLLWVPGDWPMLVITADYAAWPNTTDNHLRVLDLGRAIEG